MHLAGPFPQLDFMIDPTCPTHACCSILLSTDPLRGTVGHHASCARPTDGCDDSAGKQLTQIQNMRQHAAFQLESC